MQRTFDVVSNAFSGFFNRDGRHVVTNVRLLRGGMTNQSYLVRTESNEYVARLQGKGSGEVINREHEAYNTAAVIRLGLTPEILYDKDGKKVTRFLKYPQTMNNIFIKWGDYLQQAAQALRKLHTECDLFANTIDVFERNRYMLNMQQDGKVTVSESIVRMRNGVDEIERVIRRSNIEVRPCHNDTIPGNFILSEGRMQLIDFEYSGNNDPLWDLACLAMEAELTDDQSRFLLLAYYGNELNDNLRTRFYLYQPVVEYWTVLWCRWQLCHVQDEQRRADLETIAERRGGNCLALFDGERIKGMLANVSEDDNAIEESDDVENSPRCLPCIRRYKKK